MYLSTFIATIYEKRWNGTWLVRLGCGHLFAYPQLRVDHQPEIAEPLLCRYWLHRYEPVTLGIYSMIAREEAEHGKS